jgi:hypothetical protein
LLHVTQVGALFGGREGMPWWCLGGLRLGNPLQERSGSTNHTDFQTQEVVRWGQAFTGATCGIPERTQSRGVSGA